MADGDLHEVNFVYRASRVATRMHDSLAARTAAKPVKGRIHCRNATDLKGCPHNYSNIAGRTLTYKSIGYANYVSTNHNRITSAATQYLPIATPPPLKVRFSGLNKSS